VIAVTVMVEFARVAVTGTPAIAPSSWERTSPASAGSFCAQDLPW
jgi:hypothetical protein